MSEFTKITEQSSPYRHLDQMPVEELLLLINKEDQKVPLAIEKELPQIKELTEAIIDKMYTGGRLFYIGAGTSGRLAVVDASECPPTFGIPPGMVVAIIAGGQQAFTSAVENAEDSETQGWEDLLHHQVSAKDVVIGIASSGTTPYVVGALQECKKRAITTGCLTNNPGSPLTRVADYPIVIEVGPEFITGSTRMKGGTSQKLVLNMISTTVMIQLGTVEDNKMVNMQLSNDKLVERGTKIIMEKLGLTDYEKAKELLLRHGSVKKAIDHYNLKI